VTSPQRLTMTIAEAAHALGISRNSAYEAVRRGEIPSLRLGRRLVVPTRQLLRLLGDADEGNPACRPGLPSLECPPSANQKEHT
jgi:excisionase family DNA binding protein